MPYGFYRRLSVVTAPDISRCERGFICSRKR